MAAFVSRYARAFADVVASAKLDTAAIDRQPLGPATEERMVPTLR